MDKNSLILMALALILSITLIFTGSGSCNLHSPIYINLSISKTPLVNESADLTCNVSSIMDAPNTTAIISLPEGVELVSGELNGRWDLKANDPVHLNATIRFSKAGDFQIKAAARRAIDANNFWGDSDSIYLTIGKEASSFTLPLPWAGYPSIQESEDGVRAEAVEGRVISIDPRALPRPDELPVASRGQDPDLYDSSSAIAEQSAEKMTMKFGESLENATAPASPGALLVKGTWLYNGSDSVFRTDDGDELLPCKRMLVEVVKASNLSQVLGIGFTNSNGAFSINISNDGSAFYIFLWTYTSYGPGYELRVVDPSNTSLTGLNGVYYWHAGPFTSSDGTFNMGRAWPNPIYPRYRACWLHQDLWRADDFLYDYGLDGYQATIAWSPTINVGTYYTHGGQIRIAAGKEYASHVVIHEYGHNYMYREYGNYFPPFDCPTHWVENCYDNGCGWTEGWADFFCIAVNNDTVYKDPDFSFDFEPGDWDTPGYCDGPTCEGRVAGALWDIFDSNPDGIDLSAYSWGYDEIANVFVNANQNIFADFWNQWRGYGYSDDAAHCLWQNTIDPGINLRPNTPSTPTGPGTGYTGTSYTFSTSAVDPRDGNNVRFAFDWGDGTYSTTGYVPSNTTASASHVWIGAGTKSIKANATDSNNLSSYLWSNETEIEIVAGNASPDKIGVFRNGPWYLDYNGNRIWDPESGDLSFWLGTGGDIPIAGDWNGDGIDEIGVFRNGPWYLDYNGNRVWDPESGDISFWLGTTGDIPVAGDWNGDGKDEIGVFRNGPWYLDYNGNRVWDPESGDISFWLGTTGDVPVAGDWNGDGKDEIGVFRNGPWYLDYNGNREWDPLSGDVSFWFGTTGDVPVAGDWNVDGKDEIGVFRNGPWYLDYNGNREWDPLSGDVSFWFGTSGDKPVSGRWS